ncbi:NAD-dependent succinate-semialdehyde dehydrogenase [Variovorax sp. PBL-E5]|uniref:NAD-dependent succinate-semialdehyde dehydrogenase n=1 Tax=Variovorax sp. PBL-E5 TaxID=434014 RepID=UPI001318AC22|nr:NAD-dependent succinate-semialdehyde dehydrogenase [Variovorax sp. PBL-E5]VTU37789.1 Alpha-ketoglutaric semialdehyde dehydrogenase [Variovorax sp. PBL-E5]
MTSPDLLRLFIAGEWTQASDGATLDVHDPADSQCVARVACATRSDVERAVASAVRGFARWQATPARERSAMLDAAAERLQQRADDVARLITREQGKPLAEAHSEIRGSIEVIRWFAEEGRRVYGRVIAPRHAHTVQMAVREPVGPVAAFTPWNYPVSQAVRKVAAALAAGCSVILKGAEEAPSSVVALVEAFIDAGLPPDVLNLLFGRPADISAFLIPHPSMRAVTFTGSTAVGKQLAALAGAHMKRVTMELGGHAPAIVCADADVDHAARMLAEHKFHNAGQSCIAPTRILVEAAVFDAFCARFVEKTNSLRVGRGTDEGVTMGPLANARRVTAMRRLTDDALLVGARLLCGGEQLPGTGAFWQPTVLANVPAGAAAMNEEPFGPLALVNRFDTLDDAVAEANRLPYGLAAYAFTRSQRKASELGSRIAAGMVTINEYGLAYAEVPFNGIKDSGFGSEGGTEALESFLNTKFISHRQL